MKQTAYKWIDENQKHLTGMSDKIWEYAELGLWETRSSKLIADELEKHGFKLTTARVFDMFPHTHHVETVALFERD